MLFQKQNIIDCTTINFIQSVNFILVKIQMKIWRCGWCSVNMKQTAYWGLEYLEFNVVDSDKLALLLVVDPYVHN
jgi:ribosomal protein L37AE/L43A